MTVNLKGMWLTVQAVLPVMREQGGGAIVNISSMAAVAARSSWSAYGMSKAGVNKLDHIAGGRQRRHDDPLQLHHARADGHADGGRARRRGEAADPTEEIRAQRDAQVPLDARWAPAGTSPTRACSWPRTRPGSSPAAILPVDGGQLGRIG